MYVHPALGAADGLVRFRETRTDRGPLVALLPAISAPAADSLASDGQPSAEEAAREASEAIVVTIGHQQAADSPRSCPACADDEVEGEPPPATAAIPAILASIRLAAVAVAIDSRGRVLLTRRPRSMRTFPGAWVLPGGAVDATDESVLAAALRELREETGIEAAPLADDPEGAARGAQHGARPNVAGALCVWESCYPTTTAGWAQARREGGRTAHHLVVFCVVAVADGARVTLQGSECDAACWVHPAALCVAPGQAAAGHLSAEVDAAVGSSDERAISSEQLRGIYPNSHGEGVGRGHLWAIHRLFALPETDGVRSAATA
jgi:8-oxo-dGTP pyrophosphatase MutT (NUDIX family)